MSNLKIKKIASSQYEADVYINDKLFPAINSPVTLNSYFCNFFSDFIFLSNYSFQELIENEVESIFSHNKNMKENTNCHFSYSINTAFKNPEYLKMIEEYEIYNPNEGGSYEYIEKGNYIEASLVFKHGEWKKLYSIKEFQLFLFKTIESNESFKEKATIYWSDNDPYDKVEKLKLDFRNIQKNETPNSYINKIVPLLTRILDEVLKNLDNQYQIDIYSTYFNFPEEFKVSCKQYLIYFAQFLLDLGISVNTEISDTPEGTFFKVIPKDKNEAIENIKQLLFEYMNAPNNLEVSNVQNDNNDLGVMQFQANVYHLKSQLAFANTQTEMKQAIIQMKEATIQSLNLTNYQLSEKIESLAKKDEEVIIDGVLSVTKIEKAGIKINLPESIRKLKRKIL